MPYENDVKLDYFYQDSVGGDVATKLLNNNMNINVLRPWREKDGRSYFAANVNGKNVARLTNNATLLKEEWIQLDKAVLKTAKARLGAVQDLRSRGLTFNIPNGMGKTILQYQTQSDISAAEISMDGLNKSAGDRPDYGITSLPLPIIHKDFTYTAREIQESRNGNMPLDTTTAELATRKVMEFAEQLLCGTASTYTFGGATVYGYENYTNNQTYTITDYDDSAWTGSTILEDVLAMRQLAYDAYFYGPFALYFSSDWDQKLDEDFKTNSDKSIRSRLNEISNIETIKTLDYLSEKTVILVQMTPEVVREVIGSDVTTLQWQTEGGMKFHFKVMAIMVPQLRCDYNSNCGIVCGTTT